MKKHRRSRLPRLLGWIAFAVPVLMFAKLMHWSHTNGMIGPAEPSAQLLGGLTVLAFGAALYWLVWWLTTLTLRVISSGEAEPD